MNIIKKIVRVIGFSIWAFLKTITVSLYKNIEEQTQFAVHPHKKEQLSRSMTTDKKTKVIEERLKTVERLTYAIHNDPTYVKSDKGQHDIKELKKKVKR